MPEKNVKVNKIHFNLTQTPVITQTINKLKIHFKQYTKIIFYIVKLQKEQ